MIARTVDTHPLHASTSLTFPGILSSGRVSRNASSSDPCPGTLFAFDCHEILRDDDCEPSFEW